MDCNRQNFFSFWTIFYPFTPITIKKIKIKKKNENKPGDIIILHKCTIKEDHMMHGSLDIKAQQI